MKRFLYILTVFALTGVAACSTTDDDQAATDAGRAKIRLTSEMTGMTRGYAQSDLQGTQLESGTAVGVFIRRSDMVDNTYGYDNLEYIADGNGSFITYESPFMPQTMTQCWVHIYAYAPIDYGMGFLEPFMFFVSEDQTSDEDYLYSYLLLGTPKAGNPVKYVEKHDGQQKTVDVTLSFRHALSKLTFNFEPTSVLSDDGLVNAYISLPQVATATTVDVAAGTATTDPESLSEIHIATVDAAGQNTANCVLPAQTIPAGTEFIRIETWSSGFYKYVLPEDLVLEEGKHYTFNVQVGYNAVDISSKQIENWSTPISVDANGVAD